MKLFKHRVMAVVVMLLLALPSFTGVFAGKAAAVIPNPDTGSGTSFDPNLDQHIDRSTILYNGVYYFDSQIDNNYTYLAQGQTNGCTNKIDGLKSGNTQATVHTYTKDPTTGSCHDTKKTITLLYPERSYMPFDYLSATQIQTSDKKTTYTYNSSVNAYLEDGGDSCKDVVKVTAGPDDTGATLSVLASTGGSNTAYDKWSDQVAFNYDNVGSKDNCTTYGPNSYKASTVYFNNQDATKNAPGAQTLASTGSAQGASDTPDCESSGVTLSWIFCPVINGLASAIDGMYGTFIKPMLVSAPIDPSGTHQCEASDEYRGCDFAIWSEFRIFGDIFLVIALLVVVFGQSLGGGLIDAYAAKKILPRLLIAAVLINLSLYIVSAAVDITNILGNGIQKLLTSPFSDAGAFKLTLNGATTGTLGLTTLLGGGAVAGTIWLAIAHTGVFLAIAADLLPPLIMFVALFILLPGFLIFISIVATVLIRKGLIIFLVLTSPVAFALYCLPNTEQYFRKWWDLLLRTLLVYPIIALVFTLSDIMAVTIQQGGDTSWPAEWVAQLMSIAALILPLFLIPFSFRLAGGIIGKAHEVFDGYRKRTQEAIKGNANDPGSLRNRTRRNAAAALARHDLSGRGISTRLNPTTMVGSRRQLRRARLEATRNMYEAHYGKQGVAAQMYEQYKDDSHVTGDLAKYGSSKASRDAIEADIAAGRFARNSAEHQQRMFASAAADKIGRTRDMRRRALMNSSTIGYEFEPGEEGWAQADAIMRELSNGNQGTYNSLMNEFQFVAKSAAGRTDLAAGVDGEAYNGDRAYSQESLYGMANGKPAAIRGHGQHFSDQFINGGDAGKKKAAIFYKELEAMKSNAKGGVRDAIIEQQRILENQGIKEYMNTQVTDATGAPVTRRQRRVDPNDANNYIYVDEPVTLGDQAQREARVYERPDPNHMGEDH